MSSSSSPLHWRVDQRAWACSVSDLHFCVWLIRWKNGEGKNIQSHPLWQSCEQSDPFSPSLPLFRLLLFPGFQAHAHMHTFPEHKICLAFFLYLHVIGNVNVSDLKGDHSPWRPHFKTYLTWHFPQYWWWCKIVLSKGDYLITAMWLGGSSVLRII